MHNLKKISIFLILLLITITISYSQEIPTPTPTEVTELELGALDLDTKVNLAITTPDYPVTPGDIYILNFFNSIISKSIILRVSSNGSVDISSFGTVETQGMLYSDFVEVVKSKIDASYEDTHTQISIRSVGTFQVQITGEVKTSKLLNVWGLSRLSTLVEQNLTAYTSIRNIEVIDSNGKKHIYDLYKASRLGQLDQDPYIRPGDKIVLSKYDRKISITGEVRRPGTYQLLAGETLADVIYNYGDGFTLFAATEIEITKWNKENLIPEAIEYINYSITKLKEIEITNLDKIKINSKKDEQQLVYFEGAVNGNTTSIIKYPIREGELLSSAIRFLKNQFPIEADLDNTYIELWKESKIISIDLIDLLYNNNKDLDIILNHNDRITIPFRQYFVNISGEVNSPGRYAYIPNRTWSYYINMAGGFNSMTHSGNKIEIIDYNNHRKDLDEIILPEDTIIAPANDIIYNINKYTVLVGVIASVVTSILTVSLLMGQ